MAFRNDTNTLTILAIAAMVVAAIIVAAPIIDIRPINIQPGNGLEEVVPYPPFVEPTTVNRPGHEVWFSPDEMPPLPDCKDLGIEECKWEVWNRDDSGNSVIEVELRDARTNRLYGRAEMMRVQVREFDELVHLQRYGINESWMARIQVKGFLRGNGVGKLLWRAGDSALKIVTGGGATRVFWDNAGWGPSLMRYVDDALMLVKRPPLWVYVVE